MGRISAASNLVVDVQPQRWRLLIDGNGSFGERVLVEAKPGEPIRYLEVFGSRRRLPESGVLALEDVERVALGWSTRDNAWHLGLVLSNRIAEARGSRWCEIVHWEDPQADQHRDAAVEAAHKLAAQIDRPFALIPPKIEAAAPEPVIEVPPPQPLPELPTRLEQWNISAPSETSIELTLSPSWGRSRLLRAAWYIIWTGVFIILSTTSLTSGIALPRPEFLVYLGFISAGILVIATIYTLYNVATRPNRLLIDSQSVRWLRDRSLQRRIAAADIQGVYASHITTRPNKRQNERSVTYGELNLYLKDGTFECVITHSASGEHLPAGDDPDAKEALTPLTPADAHTRLQIIALYAAERLGVPCWFDRRTS